MEWVTALEESEFIRFNKEDVTVVIKNGALFRHPKANTRRYFIYDKDGNCLCTIKRIPRQHVFDIERIVQVQEEFRKFQTCSSPLVYHVHPGSDGFSYIVEEYIDGHIVDESDCESQAKAARIIEDIYSEIQIKLVRSGNISDVLDRDIKAIEEGIEILGFRNFYNGKLLQDLQTIYNQTAKAFLTTSDLISRNIIFTKKKPVIVDFDLSRETSFLWMDFIRSKYYSNSSTNWSLGIGDFGLKDVDPLTCEILFFINEVKLQSLFEETSIFSQSLGGRKATLLPLLEKRYGKVQKLKDTKPKSYGVKAMIDHELPISKGELFAQFFWNDNGVFIEEKSIKLPVKIDDEYHEYWIEFPKGFTSQIRFDPINTSCIAYLKEVTLFERSCTSNEFDEVKRYCVTKSSEVNITSENLFNLPNDSACCLVTNHADPQIVIDIPRYSGNQTIALKIKIKVQQLDLYSLIEVFPRIRGLIEENRSLLKEKQVLVGDNQTLSLELQRVSTECRDTENQLDVHRQLVERLQDEVMQYKRLLAEAQQQLAIIENSTSWRVTKPLRKIGQISKRIYDSEK